MVAARKDGKKAMLISDKLIIDNQKYTLNNLESLPLKLQPQNLALRTTDKAIMFYGKNCCFSNFYDAKFTLDGITYSSSQQYFQYQKAMRMGNDDIATKIMETSDPVEQHRLGKQVTINKDRWNNKLAKQVMEVGVKGKFEQNPGIRDLLVATGKKNIIECNKYDTFWGNGLSLYNVEAMNQNKWKGENALSNILIQVREGLK